MPTHTALFIPPTHHLPTVTHARLWRSPQLWENQIRESGNTDRLTEEGERKMRRRREMGHRGSVKGDYERREARVEIARMRKRDKKKKVEGEAAKEQTAGETLLTVLVRLPRSQTQRLVLKCLIRSPPHVAVPLIGKTGDTIKATVLYKH